MADYRHVMKTEFFEESTMADTSSIQAALEGLQRKGLIWNASRGVYMIEDDTLPAVMLEAGMLA